ncbi:MAG: hypothetical protein KJ607_07395, partial [Bacteroidetes bacterium]|nr:hypothetical protein [Bacteroidota bacterium]
LLSAAWLVLRNSMFDGPVDTGMLFSVAVIPDLIKLVISQAGKCFIPVNQTIISGMEDESIIPGLISIGVITILAVKFGFHSARKAVAGIALYVIIITPPLFFMLINDDVQLTEHRLYMPMIGLIIFVSQIKISYGRLMSVLGIIIILIFGVKAHFRSFEGF